MAKLKIYDSPGLTPTPSPTAFSVQVSRDGQNWTDIHVENEGKGGTSDIQFNPVEARHVRVYGTKRGTEWGHAIRELAVFQ